MSYLVFLGFFLLASITTSYGQTCSADATVINGNGRVRDVRRVKFYLDPSGTTIPFYIRKKIFTKAFDTWEAQTCVKFAITSVKKGADIVLQFSPVGGPAGTVATASAPGPPFQVTLTFDSGETWATDFPPPEGSLDLHSVALHLIGHGIGLEHITDPDVTPAVVMNQNLVGCFPGPPAPIKTTLTTADINAAQAKYGPAC